MKKTKTILTSLALCAESHKTDREININYLHKFHLYKLPLCLCLLYVLNQTSKVLVAVRIKLANLLDVPPCSVVDTDVSEDHAAAVLNTQ